MIEHESKKLKNKYERKKEGEKGNERNKETETKMKRKKKTKQMKRKEKNNYTNLRLADKGKGSISGSMRLRNHRNIIDTDPTDSMGRNDNIVVYGQSSSLPGSHRNAYRCGVVAIHHLVDKVADRCSRSFLVLILKFKRNLHL